MSSRPRILVAGGAGYIGSHAVAMLDREGFEPVILDDLSRGHFEAVAGREIHRCDLRDHERVRAVLHEGRFEAVMHFAAFCYVGESVTDPATYWDNNVAATLSLLRAMVREGLKRFLFSSTCAVFGNPMRVPMDEGHPKAPINPYGKTKLTVERMLEDFDVAYGMRHVNLRYFNAAGADPSGERGEDHRPETHVIPLLLQSARDGGGKPFTIFGDDYDTPDGTCIRDYIHILDLASAHILALRALLEGASSTSYNLGNGVGVSVRELLDAAQRISGASIPHRIGPRRPGDPPRLVGDSRRVVRELGWKPRFTGIDEILRTAWNWHREHPRGYGGGE